MGDAGAGCGAAWGTGSASGGSVNDELGMLFLEGF
jgi:hypothetical protein